MQLVALLALVSSSSGVVHSVPIDEKPIFVKDIRIVTKPGSVIEKGNILISGGKIERIGSGFAAPAGAEIIEGEGLSAYPGFINPFFSTSVSGLGAAEEPAGGGRGQRTTQSSADQAEAQRRRDADPFGFETNSRLNLSLREVKETEISSLASFAKGGYTLVDVNPSGGLIGAESGVFATGTAKVAGSDAGLSPMLRLNLSGRSFGSYPGSTMGTIAFVRQFLYNSKGFKGGEDKFGYGRVQPALNGQAKVYFDGLNDVSFFQAKRISGEFGLKPVYAFQSGAGAVLAHLKAGSDVVLKGVIPSKPVIGENTSGVSVDSVRAYFNELQVGAELAGAGVKFSYAPGSSDRPLEGLRTYVRAGLSPDVALAAITTEPASLLGVQEDRGTLEAGKRADLVLVEGDLFHAKSQVMATIVGGKRADFEMPKRLGKEAFAPEPALKTMPTNHRLFPQPAERTTAARLYKNATIWTMGSAGTLRGADILISGGKVMAVGRGLKAPAGVEVIDATGKHISPGIWDCHSHTAISGGVNEGSQMVTVQCRIRDVVNHTDTGIYLQLSGGTVGANQLHGSANAIGGQSNTVKWRWGMEADDLHVSGAPEGVKFALGQNPIREDGGSSNVVGNGLLTFRPRTRMGVDEAIRIALQKGKEYQESWDDFKAGRTKVEPTVDLQLEGLAEIVTGKRLIHSHGYRSDEMLMLIRIAKQYGAKLQTLQHVLEGYKIADEMREAGVGGSTFADWWGYKLEAYDAIPHNAALMADRGVSVSVNSDSNDHARRLNIEGAKSMRYGGVSPEKALSFVTIEPARQLGIADKTGSLEVGKDADMVIWSAEPTSMRAICLETYVDGVKRFDRKNDAEQRIARDKELEAARGLLTEAKENSPFDTGGDIKPAETEVLTPTTAEFGIAKIMQSAGSSRYKRSAILISGATVHPMVGDPFVGDVLVDETGKIAAVGRNLSASGAVRFNARGKHLYPGLIDPAAGLGLNEIGQVPASDDSSERGNFHPDYRVERVLNPEWQTLNVARNQGVLTVLTKPSGGGVPGQAALIHTEGFTWEDLTIQGGVALAYSVGGGGGAFFAEKCECENIEQAEEHDHEDEEMRAGLQRQGGGSNNSLETLSGYLEDARAYSRARRLATPLAPVARDQAKEAMLQVALGQLPVLISVNGANEIKQCVEWAEKEGIKIMLYGCSGAGDIAEWLAAKQVPICLNGVFGMPRADQPVDYYYNLPARLTEAGVKFCLTTNDDKDTRQLRDLAGWASTYGVDREEAIRLITLRPAEIMGIDDRLGSIRVGLEGTLILTDGDLTEVNTQVLKAWIMGREVPLTSRQTDLYDRYRKRPLGGN